MTSDAILRQLLFSSLLFDHSYVPRLRATTQGRRHQAAKMPGIPPIRAPSLHAHMHCAGSSESFISMAKGFAEDRRVVSNSGKVSAIAMLSLQIKLREFTSAVYHCSCLYLRQLIGVLQYQHVSLDQAREQHNAIRSKSLH
jgi:hypothetical protein